MDPPRLVDVVHHLAAARRPTTDALRLIAEGTLPAYVRQGRPGWWVDPKQLEPLLAQHAARLRTDAAARRTQTKARRRRP